MMKIMTVSHSFLDLLRLLSDYNLNTLYNILLSKYIKISKSRLRYCLNYLKFFSQFIYNLSFVKKNKNMYKNIKISKPYFLLTLTFYFF